MKLFLYLLISLRLLTEAIVLKTYTRRQHKQTALLIWKSFSDYYYSTICRKI